MPPRDDGRPARKTAGAPAVPLSSLGRDLEDLGLSSNESKVLLALLQLGSANTLQLARLSQVPRTSIYPVLKSLATKGLADLLPGEGPAMWASPGGDEVVNRLDAWLEECFHNQRDQVGRVREDLARLLPEASASSLPNVRLVPGAIQAKRAYEQLLGEAEREVLMFTRPPYSWVPGKPNPAVVDMLARGVDTRVLYQASQLTDGDDKAFRNEIETYHELGVLARVVDELPMKLVVVDRRVSLLALTRASAGFPTALRVDDPGCAAVHAAAFEHLWAGARPYPARLDLDLRQDGANRVAATRRAPRTAPPLPR